MRRLEHSERSFERNHRNRRKNGLDSMTRNVSQGALVFIYVTSTGKVLIHATDDQQLCAMGGAGGLHMEQRPNSFPAPPEPTPHVHTACCMRHNVSKGVGCECDSCIETFRSAVGGTLFDFVYRYITTHLFRDREVFGRVSS